MTNANLTIEGALGTDVYDLYGNKQIENVPVLAVSNYDMTNTSWFLNEFQFYGSIGFGRPANPQ
jgi:hypothetical protein